LTIKAVLFDLGNTLVYSHPEVTFRRILAEHGIAKSLDAVTEALVRGNAEFDIEKHEELTAHEFYTRWNTVQLKHLGLKGPKARKLAGIIDSQWWKYGVPPLPRRTRDAAETQTDGSQAGTNNWGI
jgi:FMN phosphatase YigB (HAD superfamily)